MSQKSTKLLLFEDDNVSSYPQQDENYTKLTTGKSFPTIIHNRNSQITPQQLIKKAHPAESYLQNIEELRSRIQYIERVCQQIKSQLSGTSSTKVQSNHSSDLARVLFMLEKKESKKSLHNFSSTVDQKLSSLNKKIEVSRADQDGSCNLYFEQKVKELEDLYQRRIENLRKNYQAQYGKLVEQAKAKEELLLQRLSEIEVKFMNRLNSLESKEQQYVDWIHHLQARLREKKNKKMITITQDRPQYSTVTGQQNNKPHNNGSQQLSKHQYSKNFKDNPRGLNQKPTPNETSYSVDERQHSKLTRKRKIFGRKNQSVSPQERKSSMNEGEQLKTLKNPSNQRDSQSVNLGFYNQIKNLTPSRVQSREQMIRRSTILEADEKHGAWDNFNDFNSSGYTENESDDFFTPVEAQEIYSRREADDSKNQHQGFLTNIPAYNDQQSNLYKPYEKQQMKMPSYRSSEFQPLQGSSKVFSPLDLN